MNDDIYYENWIHSLEQAQKKQDKLLSLLLKPSIDVETFTTTFFSRVVKKEEFKPSSIETNKSTQVYRAAMAEMQWKGKRSKVKYKVLFYDPSRIATNKKELCVCV